MRRFAWLAVATLVAVPSLSFGLNEIQIGETEAYFCGNGVIRVPLIVSNDVKFDAWEVAFRISAPMTLTADSVSTGGRFSDLSGSVVNTFVYPDGNNVGSRPMDSGGVLVALKYPYAIQPGTGTICNLWFSGAQIGDVITFEIVDTIRTSGAPEIITAFAGIFTDLVYPTFRTTQLTVVPEYLVAVPTSVQGYTLREVRIPASASGLDIGDLQVLGFTGPDGEVPFPVIEGDGPWEIVWTPSLHSAGAYLLQLRFANGLGQVVNKSIAISVIPSTLTGDIDCDGKVDLSDLSRIINWLINRTLPPVCP